jgi:hypothetical protein
MRSGMLSKLAKAIINSIGFKTKRKLVIFCSDDWGGIRVYSKTHRSRLIEAGINMESNRFDQFDTLESNEDLEALFESLLKHKDCNGNHPVFTAVMNVANPDFLKIKNGDFQHYFFEPFVQTFQRYPKHDRVFSLYKEGIANKIFKPQLHGREHLQVQAWMKALQNKDAKTIKAFEFEFFFLIKDDVEMQMAGEYAESFNFWDKREIAFHKEVIASGVKLFNDAFGYRPIFFTAPAQPFSDELNGVLKEIGIEIIDVPRLRKVPIGRGKYKAKIHYLGQKNYLGLRYITRNAVFESNLLGCGLDSCLMQIRLAFDRNQPAIISNHRASFVGGLCEKNRKSGLKELDQLLRSILKQWPDVEFIDIQELSKTMTDHV